MREQLWPFSAEKKPNAERCDVSRSHAPSALFQSALDAMHTEGRTAVAIHVDVAASSSKRRTQCSVNAHRTDTVAKSVFA